MAPTTAQQKDSGAAFFDQRAEDYNREYADQTAGGYALRIRREKVLRLFDQPGGKVLDVGCGPGAMAQQLVNRGCTFWGVDPAAKMLEICRRRFSTDRRAQFLQGDAARLALPTGFFDAVLCMGVIDGLPDRRQAVCEMLRVLRPGGTLIITFTNFWSPYSWWKKYVFYPAVGLYQRLRDTGRPSGRRFASVPAAKQRALFSKSATRELLESEGGEVVQILGYYFNIFLSPLDEIFPALALRTTRTIEESRWPKPEWIASGWIVKVKKRDRVDA